MFVKLGIVHCNKYSYLRMYKDKGRNVLVIRCEKHKQFPNFTKNKIYKKQDCPKCFKVQQLTKADFIRKVKEKHNDRYDYSTFVYSGGIKPISVSCRQHGEFVMFGKNYIVRHVCSKCALNAL